MNIKHFIIKNKLNNVIVGKVLKRAKALETEKPVFKTLLSTYYVHDIGQIILPLYDIIIAITTLFSDRQR